MDEPTRVFVLRHGQTAWNASRRIQGHVDEPLDDALHEDRDESYSRELWQRLNAVMLEHMSTITLKSLVDEQIALEGERLRLAERKLEAASRDAQFSEQDLAQIRRTEEQQVERIRGLRVKAGERAVQTDRELAAATEALRRAEADPKTDAGALQVARARQRAAPAAKESARKYAEAVGTTVDQLKPSAERYLALTEGREEADPLPEVELDPGRPLALSWIEPAGCSGGRFD